MGESQFNYDDEETEREKQIMALLFAQRGKTPEYPASSLETLNEEDTNDTEEAWLQQTGAEHRIPIPQARYAGVGINVGYGEESGVGVDDAPPDRDVIAASPGAGRQPMSEDEQLKHYVTTGKPAPRQMSAPAAPAPKAPAMQDGMAVTDGRPQITGAENSAWDGVGPSVSAGQKSGTAGADAADAQVGLTQDEDLKRYLQQYEKGADNSGINAALAEQRSGNRTANIGEALEWLARSNSMAHGGPAVDPNLYNKMREGNQNNVKNAFALQQQKLGAILQKFNLERGIAQDAMQRGDARNKAFAAQLLRRMNDPNSEESIRYYNALAGITGKADELEGLSATELAEVSKVLISQDAAAHRNAMLGVQMDNTNYMRKKDAVSYFDDMNAEANNPSNPVMKGYQAQRAAVENARHMLEDYKGDLNAMPSNVYNKFAHEMAIVMARGPATVATQHSAQFMTLKSALAAMRSKGYSAPEPAQMGAFLKDDIRYLDRVDAGAKAALNKHIRDIDTQKGGHLTPEKRAEFRALYPEVFYDRAKDGSRAGTPPPGRGATPPAPSGADAEAIKWARDNPTDPRAKAILERNGLGE